MINTTSKINLTNQCCEYQKANIITDRLLWSLRLHTLAVNIPQNVVSLTGFSCSTW